MRLRVSLVFHSVCGGSVTRSLGVLAAGGAFGLLDG